MNIKSSVMTRARILVVTVLVAGWGAVFVLGRAPQAPDRQTSPTVQGELRLILGKQHLGSKEISIAERLWPANYEGAEHSHETIEVVYVLSGECLHILNGQTQVLGPGMVGFVKPGDKVRHKTGPQGPTRALLISVPGDEERFRQRGR